MQMAMLELRSAVAAVHIGWRQRVGAQVPAADAPVHNGMGWRRACHKRSQNWHCVGCVSEGDEGTCAQPALRGLRKVNGRAAARLQVKASPGAGYGICKQHDMADGS
jgi:hypothetical protein